MFCNIHLCFKAGGFKKTKTFLTRDLILQQIAIYIQTPAIVFLVRTHTRPSQQLTEQTHILLLCSFFLQMIYRTPVLFYCMWMSFFDTCALCRAIPSHNRHYTLRVCVCVSHVCLFSQSVDTTRSHRPLQTLHKAFKRWILSLYNQLRLWKCQTNLSSWRTLRAGSLSMLEFTDSESSYRAPGVCTWVCRANLKPPQIHF